MTSQFSEMYPILTIVLCLLFQPAFSVDSASDKESLKKSLGQVSQFLQNVGQSIQNEKSFIDTVTIKKSTVITNTDKFTVDKTSFNNRNVNFFQSIDNDKVGPKKTLLNSDSVTKNLAINYGTERNTNSIHRLADGNAKDNYKSNTDIDKKSGSSNQNQGGINANKIESKYVSAGAKNNVKKKEGRESDVDIFGDMVFPTKSELPENGTVKTTASTPEVLRPEFINQKVPGGPQPGLLSTPTTTTVHREFLLDPPDFGYTTTRKPIPTYGDPGPTYIPPKYLTNHPGPTAFFSAFMNDMTKHGAGVFTTAMLKIFHWVIFKKPDEVRRLVWGFGRLVEHYASQEKLDDFGQPTKHAFVTSMGKASSMPADERRTQAILLQNMLQNRWDLLSEEVNFILDHIDSMFLKEEADNLIRSMEPIDQFSDATGVPYTHLESFTRNILAPWRRLKDTVRGEILRENLNRALKKRFYGDQEYYSGIGGHITNDKSEEVFSRKRNDIVQKFNNTGKYYNNNTDYDEKNVERKTEDNSKEENWIPNVTYRAGKNKIGKKDNYETEEDVMRELTAPPRSITTRPRNKRIKKNEDRSDRPSQKYDEDKDSEQHKVTKSGSSPKKHHKKRHNRHKRKHRSKKHRLEKILKLIKYLRPHHKRDKHRKHHHRISKLLSKFRVSSEERSKRKHASKSFKDDHKSHEELAKEERSQKKKHSSELDKTKTYTIPTKPFYKFEEQMHDKRDLAFRRSLRVDKIERMKAIKLREYSEGSDEEIRLKMNLLKAMGGEDQSAVIHAAKAKNLLESSFSSDEEAFLKRQLYKYL